MKISLSRIYWGRVIWTSILVVLLSIILNSLLVWLALSIWGKQEQILFQFTLWIPSLLSLLLTGVCAVWVARKAEREAVLHGFFVGLLVALILLIFSPSVTNFFQGTYQGRIDLLVAVLVGFVLTIAAGWFGGVLGSRGR